MHLSTSRISMTALGLLAGVSTGLAGELTPPAGPLVPTMKTLVQIEPRTALSQETAPGNATATYRITQPGSYYLTSNIQGESGKHGIEIAASNVTLDLNGFSLLDNGTGKVGIKSSNSYKNVRVVNGSVSGWGLSGVEIGAGTSSLQNVVSGNNGNAGFMIGTGGTIRNCVAHHNTSCGIVAFGGSLVTDCIAHDNTLSGIALLLDGTTAGGTIENCNARKNKQCGILASTQCQIKLCDASQNGTSGIYAGDDCRVSDCSVLSNGETGVEAAERVSIERCTVNRNSEHGISAGRDSIVRSNHCTENGTTGTGAGIFIGLLGRCTLEDNVLNANDYGIMIDNATSNVVRRNSASGNSMNYAIEPGNYVAAIVFPPASGQINGNNAAGLGSTDPNANLSN